MCSVRCSSFYNWVGSCSQSWSCSRALIGTRNPSTITHPTEGWPLFPSFPLGCGELAPGFGHVGARSCALNAKNFCTLFDRNAILYYTYSSYFYYYYYFHNTRPSPDLPLCAALKLRHKLKLKPLCSGIWCTAARQKPPSLRWVP